MRHRLVAIGLVAVAAPLRAQSTPAELAGLERYVEATMRDWGVPGVSIAVVRGDSVVYARGFGVPRAGDTARVTPETMFAIGSISKSFTAAVLGILVDERKIGWDDSVTARLPGFALADPDATRAVTIRDLLSHRTGLPGENLVFWGSDTPRAEVVRRIRYLPLRTAPRSTFEYQNLAFVAAGEIVPAVTGTSWDDFVTERIFGPLGMKRSTTRVSSLSRFTNVASPHVPGGGGRAEPIPWLDLDNAGPAGSIVASALDMTRYARLQLGRGSFGGRRVFSDSVARQMHAGSTIVPLEAAVIGPLFADAHLLEYGLGWFRQDYHGMLIVSHGGQTDGMHANLGLLPERDLAVVVLTNSVMFGYPAAITYRIFDAYLGRPASDWSAEIRRRMAAVNEGGRAPRGPVAGTVPSIPKTDLVGNYRQDYFGPARVTLEGGDLFLSMLGRKAKLEHWHYDTYRPGWADPMARQVLRLVTFERDGQGRVRRLRFDAAGPFERDRERENGSE